MSCCKFCNGRSVWCRKNKTKIKHGNIRIQSMLLLCLYVKKSLMMPNFFCYEKCILQNPPFPHSHEKFSLVNKEPPECIKSRFRIISYLKALSYLECSSGVIPKALSSYLKTVDQNEPIAYQWRMLELTLIQRRNFFPHAALLRQSLLCCVAWFMFATSLHRIS